MLSTVSVPEQFRPLFEKAQEYVKEYFGLKKEDPSKGTIEIFGQRYILIRAASMLPRKHERPSEDPVAADRQTAHVKLAPAPTRFRGSTSAADVCVIQCVIQGLELIAMLPPSPVVTTMVIGGSV